MRKSFQNTYELLTDPKAKLVIEVFYNQLRKDIKYYESPFALNDKNDHYLNYKDELIKWQISDGVYKNYKDKEFIDQGEGRIKICSIASSSRLCYWHFRDKISEGFDPEKKFYFISDKGNRPGPAANLDGSLKNTVFECKCKEILTNHKDYFLAESYKKLLKNKFEITTDFIEKNDKLIPSLKQFELNEDEKDTRDIYAYHFDVKQFITHLLGLSERENINEEIILQYVIYRPSEDIDNVLKTYVYDVVDHEFNKIRNSKVFSKFLKKHNIKLLDINYVNISEIHDLILEGRTNNR